MKLKQTESERVHAFFNTIAPASKTTNFKERAAIPLNEAFTALIQRVHDNNDYSVLRLDASASKMGRANSTFWADVKNGTVSPPIPLGEKAVGWLMKELDAILAARTLASRTKLPLDIKLFVSLLVAPRLASEQCAFTTDEAANV